MNNKDFKKSIKNYKIKTTSNQILDAYEESKKVKSKNKLIWAFAPIISAVALCIIIPNVLNNGSKEIIDDRNNQFAFQLFSGSKLINMANNNQLNIQPKKSRPANESEFADVVDIYDKTIDLVNSSYKSKDNLTKKVYEGNFTGKKYADSYKYKMEIMQDDDIMTFYYDSKIENDDDEIETELHGELEIDNDIFYVECEYETSLDEYEYEITLFAKENSYITIEQEKEIGEYSYKYSIYENNTKFYDIDFSNEENQQELKIDENNISYEFNIHHVSNELDNIDYQCDSFNGTIELRYDANNHLKIYKETSTNQEIQKNYQ